MKNLLDRDEQELQKDLMARLGSSPNLQKALDLMHQAHHGALRDGGTPYVRHPLRVALILVEEVGVHDLDLVCAALLHDVLEDCKDITYEVLQGQCGRRVANLVRAQSDELKGSDLPVAERKARYLRRIATESAECILLKMCDRLDNLRSLRLVPPSPKADRIRQQTAAYLLPLFETRLPSYFNLKEALMDAMREPAFDVQDRKGYEGLLREYQRRKPEYDELAKFLEGEMLRVAKQLGIYPIVSARAKSLDSLAEKVQRTGKRYGPHPLEELTDLCGVRVITHFLDEIQAFTSQIAEEFFIDTENSEDKKDILALNQFGYLSRHLIVRLKQRPKIDGLSAEAIDRLMNARAEIQLRTIGQHMWADVYHEMGYKNEFQLPARWQREFARAAALLESVDLGFQEIRTAMGTYESSYGAYLTQDQLERLAGRLEILLEVDENNVQAVHRLIRVFLALEGNNARLEEALKKYAPILREYPPAWRDVGFALTTVEPNPDSPGFKAGQALLSEAIKHDPNDVDAYCTLGGTYRKVRNYDEALRCYREGYQKDPTNPYALGNYIVEQLVRNKDPELINVFHGVIEGALERCYKMLEVGVNFPWTLYDLSMFLLYQAQSNASYRFLAKGIDASSHSWMVGSAAAPIRRLVECGVPLKGLDLADKMLALGESVKRDQCVAPVPANGAALFRMPLTILAGGCDDLTDDQREMLKVIPRALQGFRGTLVSGGTNVGIAAIPGDLRRHASTEELVTIGYVPANVQELGADLHSGYSHIVRTPGEGFSILEALKFWEDFWNSGGKPSDVKLVGFNGGDIAAVEYRLGLALGASVGIVRGGGREADRLLEDPLWNDHPRLRPLDASEEAVRRFLSVT